MFAFGSGGLSAGELGKDLNNSYKIIEYKQKTSHKQTSKTASLPNIYAAHFIGFRLYLYYVNSKITKLNSPQLPYAGKLY